MQERCISQFIPGEESDTKLQVERNNTWSGEEWETSLEQPRVLRS